MDVLKNVHWRTDIGSELDWAVEITDLDFVDLSGLSKSTYLTDVILPYSLHKNNV